jgi:SAM-dependent methyltransferase
LTRRLFERAGIVSGMRVLDIGSGSGDVAFLAARVVGREGSVIGADRDPAQVAFAEQRAKANGLGNVRFVAEDFRQLELNPPVDGIVGRLVLMYAADPLDALRRALRNLRSGGVIALQESVIDYDGPVLIEPPTPRRAGGRVVQSRLPACGCPSANGHATLGLMRAAAGTVDGDRHAGADPAGPRGRALPTLTAVVRSQILIVASGAATEAERSTSRSPRSGD